MQAGSSGPQHGFPARKAALRRRCTAGGPLSLDSSSELKLQRGSMPQNGLLGFASCGLPSKSDKSLKKSIDVDLQEACRLLNDTVLFRTTSCCSGRIVVFRQTWATGRGRTSRKRSETAGDVPQEIFGGAAVGALDDVTHSDAVSAAFTVASPDAVKRPGEDPGIPGDRAAGSKAVATKYGGSIVYASHTVVDEVAVCEEILRRLEAGAIHYEEKEKAEPFQEPVSVTPAEDDPVAIERVGSSDVFSFVEASVPPAVPQGSTFFPAARSSRVPPLPFPSGRTILRSACVTNGGPTRTRRRSAQEENHAVDQPPDLLSHVLSDQPLVYLKVEPLIIHVECATLADASALLAAAVSSGLKHSGLSVGKKKCVVAIRGSQRLEIPIAAVTKEISNSLRQQEEAFLSTGPTVAAAHARPATSSTGISLKRLGDGADINGDGFLEEEIGFMGVPAGEDWIDLVSQYEETPPEGTPARRGPLEPLERQQRKRLHQHKVTHLEKVAVLVTENYLRFVLRVCNGKLNKNKAQIHRFESTLKKFLERHTAGVGVPAAISRPTATAVARSTQSEGAAASAQAVDISANESAVPVSSTAGGLAQVSAEATAEAVPTNVEDVSIQAEATAARVEQVPIHATAEAVPANVEQVSTQEIAEATPAGIVERVSAEAPAEAMPADTRAAVTDAAGVEQQRTHEDKEIVFGGLENIDIEACNNHESRGNSIGTWSYMPLQGLAGGERLQLWGCACAFSYPYLCVFGGMERGRRVNTLLAYDVTASCWTQHVPGEDPGQRWPLGSPSAREVPGRRFGSSLLDLPDSRFLLLLLGRTGPEDCTSNMWLLHAGTWSWTRIAVPGQKCRYEPGYGSDRVAPPGRWRHAACVQPTTKRHPNAAAVLRACIKKLENGGETEEEGEARERRDSTGNDRVEEEDAQGEAGGKQNTSEEGGAEAVVNGEVSRRPYKSGFMSGDSTPFAEPIHRTYFVWVYGGVTGAKPLDELALRDLWRLTLSLRWSACNCGNTSCAVQGLMVEKEWKLVKTTGKCPPALHSHAMVATEEHLLLLGGVEDPTAAAPLNFRELYVFHFASRTWSLVETQGIPVSLSGFIKGDVWKDMNYPRRRFSHRAMLVERAATAAEREREKAAGVNPPPMNYYTLLLVGGCDDSVPTSDVWALDLQHCRWQFITELPCAEVSWRCRSGAAIFKKKEILHLFLIGGGGTCFTFGSHADPALQLNIPLSCFFVSDRFPFSRSSTLQKKEEDARSPSFPFLRRLLLSSSSQEEIEEEEDIDKEEVPRGRMKEKFDCGDSTMTQQQKEEEKKEKRADGSRRDLLLLLRMESSSGKSAAAAAAAKAAAAAGESTSSGSRARKKKRRSSSFSFTNCVISCMQQVAAAFGMPEDTGNYRTATSYYTSTYVLSGKYEQLGDVLLLKPADYNIIQQWINDVDVSKRERHVISTTFWQLLSKSVNHRRFAVQGSVSGWDRQSGVKMISEGGGLVNHQENGVIYRFDITECMFSSGNGTERKRFVNLIHAGGEKRPERVVDLFCGIGYFSLAALTRVPADRLQQVYACDWNANALEYFRESLRLNRVDPTRVYLFCCDSVRLPGSTARTRLLPVTRDHGDKRMVSQFSSSSSVHRCLTSVDTNCSFPSPSTCYLPEGAWPDNDPRRIYSDPAALPASLIGVADRVSLGLLPDSTAALPTALILLNKEEGGILHVHTVSDSTATCGWRAYPCNRIDVTFYQDVARMEVEKWLSEPPPKVGNEKEKECDSAGKQQQQSSEQGEKKAETEKSKRKQKAALRKLRARTYVGNPKEPELKVAQDVLQEFEKALQGDIVKSYFKPLYEQRRVWVFSIKHIERVKSFSPGKYHYVVDTDCRPETPP